MERHRRIALSAAASIGVKGITFLSTLISVPLTIRYLGTERFGLWMAMSSFVALLGFADLGMGNGLINALSDAHGRDDHESARGYVSSAFFLLGGIALLLLAALAISYIYIPWGRVYNVSTASAAREAGPASAVLLICVLINLPLGLAQRIQVGYQEGFASNLWMGAGSLLGLVFLIFVVVAHGSLPMLVGAVAGAPCLVAFANNIYVFGVQRPSLRPRLAQVKNTAVRRIFNSGIYFVIIQLAVVLAFSSDNLVAAQVLGLDNVAQYAVPFKLFAIPSMLIITILTPLWPAYGEAFARGDNAWVRRTLLRSLRLSLGLSVAASAVLFVFAPTILYYWCGPQIHPTRLLLLGLAVWMVMGAAGNCTAIFLNGVGTLRFQAINGIIMAIINVALSFLLACKIGVAGVIWGTVIAYGLFSILPTIIYIRWYLSRNCA